MSDFATKRAAMVEHQLRDQLADGGRLVVPVVSGREEMLTVLRRRGEELDSRGIAPCRFVPLIGAEGF